MANRVPRSKELRRQAEERASKEYACNYTSLSPEQIQTLFHELRVHQIELEMQNEELRHAQQQLERQRERYFDLYDVAPVGYLTLNDHGEILEVNLSAAHMLGEDRSTLIGKLLTRFVVPDDQDIYYLHQKKCTETSAPQSCELRMISADGASFWALLQASSPRNGEFRVTFSDISARKQSEEDLIHLKEELEHRVKSRTSELEAAFKQMETFSYSVSHDLRKPLRALKSYAAILEEDFAPTLPDDARKLLDRISAVVSQMDNLVDDLLTLSRVIHCPLIKESVDPAAVTREVLEELLCDSPALPVKLIIGDVPVCSADPALFKQVMINLLSNSVKFCRKQEHPCIEVGSYDEGNTTVYFVRDNGAGFDMSYADQLFEVFQRLHNNTEFEGTGVGLAIVMNIIERHGGRIWAHGEVGKGATFFFTLPDATA